MSKEIAIIGGGAAGFFAAINCAEKHSDYSICIYEGSNKLLSKVLISGGGRCNITNACQDPEELLSYYPRGHKELHKAFKTFHCGHTYSWFESRGLTLKTEEDGRVFPRSNSSQSVYDLFLRLAKKHNIDIKLNSRLKKIEPKKEKWLLELGGNSVECDKLVLATGGNAQVWSILEQLNLAIIPPAPSLFTLKSLDNEFAHLSGISVPKATVAVKGFKGFSGPLLITHQGFSGPAILKLSAWEAFRLKDRGYAFDLEVNWLGSQHENVLRAQLKEFGIQNPKSKVINYKLKDIPKRLFQHLCERAQIESYINWSEFGKKGLNRLMDEIFRSQIKIRGKNTFKEEFVTAGGVDLKEIDLNRFESKTLPSLFFAGEVLNIDAITGGFNFQSAWTSAYLISQSI